MIRRLRTNQPLTAADLKGLESTLVKIGEIEGIFDRLQALESGLRTKTG